MIQAVKSLKSFFELRAKICSYLIVKITYSSEDRKAQKAKKKKKKEKGKKRTKVTKTCVVKV